MITLSHSRRGLLDLSTATSPQELTLTPTTLPAGVVSTAYSQTITASDGTPPYTYAVTSGTLPTGLALNAATGAITGTPSVEDTFAFTITATDAFGSKGSAAYSVAVAHTYASYIAASFPALWYGFTEASGIVLDNAGSLGAAQDAAWTPGAGALAQAGALGAGHAARFDGAASVVTVPAGAHGNYPAHTIAALVQMDTAGEGNTGELAILGTGVIQMQFGNSMNAIFAYRGMSSGNASLTGTLNISTGWNWLFFTFDSGGDKKPYLYKGVNGALVTATGAQTAGDGSLTNGSLLALYIGNNSGGSKTLNGLLDEWLMWNRVLTPAEMTRIVNLSAI